MKTRPLAANCGWIPVLTGIDVLSAALTIILPAPDAVSTIEACVIVFEPEVHCANCSRFAFET